MEVGEVGPKVSEGVLEFFSESANRKLIERLKAVGVNMKEERAAPISAKFAGKHSFSPAHWQNAREKKPRRSSRLMVERLVAPSAKRPAMWLRAQIQARSWRKRSLSASQSWMKASSKNSSQQNEMNLLHQRTQSDLKNKTCKSVSFSPAARRSLLLSKLTAYNNFGG